MNGRKLTYGLITLLVGLVLWVLPPPAGMDLAGWHLLAVFIAVIIGLILRPLPMGAVVLIGVAVTALTGVLGIKEAMAGFGNKTVWLIVSAFLFARAFLKTRLGERIAYYFMRAIGRRTLFLGYSISLTDLVLAPAIPSNTARAGGVIFPIVRSVCHAYGSEPGETAKKIGKFLMYNEYHTTLITGAMFLTGMAANPLVAEFASKILNVEITWSTWFIGALVPGAITFIITPILIYLFTKPEIKVSEEAPKLASQKLGEMGPMTKHERSLLVIFAITLLMWIFGKPLKINSTTTALIWIGGLVAMATGLNKLGVIKWMAESAKAYVSGWDWLTAFIVLALVYFYAHYFMASMTAHITAFFPAFAAVMAAVGAPPMLVALLLGYFSNLMAATTHYATGPAPIYFGAGYVDIKEWWFYGLILSFVYIIIWFGVGLPHWKILGFW